MKHIKLSDINYFIETNESHYWWSHQIDNKSLYITPLPHPPLAYYRDNKDEINIKVYYVKSYQTLVAIISVIEGDVLLTVTSDYYSKTTSTQLHKLIDAINFSSIYYRDHEWLENKLQDINKTLEKEYNKYLDWRIKNR